MERGNRTSITRYSESIVNTSNSQSRQSGKQTKQEGREGFSRRDWERDWKEVAFERCVCELDDGISRRMVRLPDGTKISYAKWRQEGLKSFGNAIVPQVAINILRGIMYVIKHYTDEGNKKTSESKLLAHYTR